MNWLSWDDPKKAWITAETVLRVDQVVDVDLGGIRIDRHPFLDQPGHPRQAYRELIRDELADRADTAVAEMVDVVDPAAALAQFDQVA